MKYLFLLFALFVTSCQADELDKKMISVGGSSITVEIADTAESRQLGLMHRESLKSDEGMLFVFEEEQKLSFWMKDTSIPLSIAYISKSGVIKEIYDMVPFSQKAVQSRYSVLYALEMNQGFFEKNGIKAGDRINIPD